MIDWIIGAWPLWAFLVVVMMIGCTITSRDEQPTPQVEQPEPTQNAWQDIWQAYLDRQSQRPLVHRQSDEVVEAALAKYRPQEEEKA